MRRQPVLRRADRPGLRLLLCALGALLLSAASAHASASPGAAVFALVPEHYDPSLPATRSYFVAVARPGSTIRNSVRVTNVGSRRGTAYLYAVDATTGQTSGAVYFDRHVRRRGVGRWVSLAVRSVTLGPRQSRVVSFIVRVPTGARPGDHLGGVVAENAAVQGASGHGALRIRIRHLTIAAVEVQVPGRTSARLAAAGVRPGGEHGYQYVYLRLRNTGSVTIKPRGSLRIVNGAGTTVAVRALQLDTFLPGTAIDYPVLVPRRVLPAGHYHGMLRLRYGAAAIGYRRAAGADSELSQPFAFTVSSHQYTTVFTGVPPVSRPAVAATAPTTSGSSQTWVWLLSAAGAAVAAAAGLAGFAVRRRSRP